MLGIFGRLNPEITSDNFKIWFHPNFGIEMWTSTSPKVFNCNLCVSVGTDKDFTKGNCLTLSAKLAKINLEEGKSETSKLIFNFGTFTENMVSGR